MKILEVPIEWNPELSIFASEGFLKAVGDEYGWLKGVDESGNARYLLPYTIVRKAIFRFVRFRLEPIAIGEALTTTEEREFLNGVVHFLRCRKVDVIIPASTNAIFRAYPDGAIAAPYGTYVIDLEQSEEALSNNMSTSHRRKVRLAVKEGVLIEDGLEHALTAYTLIRETFKRSKLPFMSYPAFTRLVAGLANNVKILVARYHDAVQGCIVVPFSQHSAYYLYGGSVPEPKIGATNLLHWEAIRMFRALGAKRYDFVGVRINPTAGSKQEGLLIFKQRFGGQLVQGYIWKYSFRSLKYWLYQLAARLRSGGDIVDHEHHKLLSSQ